MVIAGIIGVTGLALPWVAVPIRRSLGLDTYMADADLSHPVGYGIMPPWLRNGEELFL